MSLWLQAGAAYYASLRTDICSLAASYLTGYVFGMNLAYH